MCYLKADILHPNARLFLELSDCSLFERLSVLNAAARCSPVVLSRERAIHVDEAEKENPSRRI